MDKRTTDALARLLDIMDELRVKCPWDREQTITSLRKNTIEETYELVDAIDEGNMDHIREELGDLLLHIVFYSKIGSEKGAFDLGDVANGISDKLVYRHPHVFSDVDAATSEQVKHNWEELKQHEGKKRKGVLSGVPKALPAMVKAYRVGEKAASMGFDWEKREDVWAKVKEESAELAVEIESGEDHRRVEAEFGDLFFSLVNAARLYDVDPEQALELTNKKFIQRFNYIESKALESGRELGNMTLAEMDILWNEAKVKL